MNDDLIPLVELQLSLTPPPTGGWDTYLADRGFRVRPDDLGRPSITREAARRLIAEHQASEARERELGVPTPAGALAFRFQRGDPVYRELVSTPGLSAIVVVDRVSSQITGVKFRGRGRV